MIFIGLGSLGLGPKPSIVSVICQPNIMHRGAITHIVIIYGYRQTEDSGSERFTWGLETNCIRQLERKLVQIILQDLQP